MKNKISYDEILYYKYYQDIVERKEYKKALKEDNEFSPIDFINDKLNKIIDEYKLGIDYFKDAKEYIQKLINDEEYLEYVQRECKRNQGQYYDSSFVDFCYGFFENKKDFFDPCLNDNGGDVVLSLASESNIHVYLPTLKPGVLLNLLRIDIYNNKLILENDLLNPKCDFVFVGYDESAEKIEYKPYPFLKKYNFISPSNITKESFNVTLGLERLSDDGIMIYNTHALNMYKNDAKSVLFRKYLIDNKLLKAAIFTKSFTRKADYEITYIISKKQSDRVVFIDAGSNQFRNFYEINPYSEEYEFGEDFMNISRIVSNYVSNYGISSVVSYENIIKKEYSFDLEEYIITEANKKRRPLEEIEMDIRNIYEEMEENLYWLELHFKRVIRRKAYDYRSKI